MTKLFISLNLDHHDTGSISQCVSDIIAHTKADHFDEEIFDDAEQFYQKSALKDENNKESLLSNTLKLDLLMEREGILDIIQKVEKKKGHEDAQYRIKQQVKNAVPSSVGLRECLKSISEKFAWSSEKMVFMILMSGFINIFMGTGFYGLDLYTDAIFSKDMLNQRNRNFSQETTACKNEFKLNFTKTIKECQDLFNSTTCMESLRKAEKIGADCFEKEQRFRDIDNINEWSFAGVIGIVHCVLPIAMSLVLWTIYECGQSSSFSIFNLALPFVTKFKRFLCDLELYQLYANKETEKEFETKKLRILNQISSHEHFVNMSLILEASLESSFQFFFQITYQLPTIILAFTTQGFRWEGLFTWKLFSIVMSFVSFSMAFNKIR